MSPVSLLVLLCCSLLEGQTVSVNGITLRQYENQENEIQSENSRDTTSTQQSCQPDIHSVLREMSAMLAELKVEQRHTTTAVNNIETRLSASESQVEELKKKSENELKDLKTSFDNQVEILKKENEEELKNLNASFDNKVEILKKENQDLKTSFDTQVEILKKENQGELKNLQTSFDNQVEILKKENQERKVAFSASLSGGESGNTGPYSTEVPLVYKHVFTNIGKAYNPVTGIFTAPVRGVYQFRFSVRGAGSKTTHAALQKNGHHIAGTLAYQPQYSVSSSNGVSLLLEVGDVVCIKLRANTWVYDDWFKYTTFSGEMLFPV